MGWGDEEQTRRIALPTYSWGHPVYDIGMLASYGEKSVNYPGVQNGPEHEKWEDLQPVNQN